MEGQGTTMKMAFNPFDNHSTPWTNVIDELNTPPARTVSLLAGIELRQVHLNRTANKRRLHRDC